jgi:hypothetical protein
MGRRMIDVWTFLFVVCLLADAVLTSEEAQDVFCGGDWSSWWERRVLVRDISQ